MAGRRCAVGISARSRTWSIGHRVGRDDDAGVAVDGEVAERVRAGGPGHQHDERRSDRHEQQHPTQQAVHRRLPQQLARLLLAQRGDAGVDPQRGAQVRSAPRRSCPGPPRSRRGGRAAARPGCRARSPGARSPAPPGRGRTRAAPRPSRPRCARCAGPPTRTRLPRAQRPASRGRPRAARSPGRCGHRWPSAGWPTPRATAICSLGEVGLPRGQVEIGQLDDVLRQGKAADDVAVVAHGAGDVAAGGGDARAPGDGGGVGRVGAEGGVVVALRGAQRRRRCARARRGGRRRRRTRPRWTCWRPARAA